MIDRLKTPMFDDVWWCLMSSMIRYSMSRATVASSGPRIENSALGTVLRRWDAGLHDSPKTTRRSLRCHQTWQAGKSTNGLVVSLGKSPMNSDDSVSSIAMFEYWRVNPKRERQQKVRTNLLSNCAAWCFDTSSFSIIFHLPTFIPWWSLGTCCRVFMLRQAMMCCPRSCDLLLAFVAGHCLLPVGLDPQGTILSRPVTRCWTLMGPKTTFKNVAFLYGCEPNFRFGRLELDPLP